MSYIKVMDELIEIMLKRMRKGFFFHTKLLFQDRATGVKKTPRIHVSLQ